MIKALGTAFLDNALDWANTKILQFAAFLIRLINKYVLDFFENNSINQFLNFSTWINTFIFCISLIIVLVDVAEERTSGKPVYGSVIFTNTVKAFAFAQFARWLAVWSMDLSNKITSYFGISLSADTFSLRINNFIAALIPGSTEITVLIHLIMMLIIIVAVLIFMVMALKRFGTMFIHIFTSALYISDIMRGDTTKMGEWLRQMTAIVLTYVFIYLLFFLGCFFFNSDDILLSLACWITMPFVSKILNRFGWSNGSQGNFGAMAIQTGVMMIR
ncbi:MAG: hypothetical protein HFJ98_06765 [Eubacterium sp.]|nr:hypothetical protein [Eubacterium sp.]